MNLYKILGDQNFSQHVNNKTVSQSEITIKKAKT